MDRPLHLQLEADPVLQAATEWFFELRSDAVSGERIAEWQQWLAQNVRHREAFERIESFWRVSDDIDWASSWPTDGDVAHDSYTGTQGVAAWQALQSAARVRSSSLTPAQRWWSPSSWVALAASVAMIGALAVLYYGSDIVVRLNGGSRLYVETQVGETRTLTLPEGSVLSAGGQTSLVATLLKHSRTVTLKHGEAFFHVAKDSARPFTVEAGGTAITALGTAFDVRRNKDRVVVAVAEGIVRVGGPPTDAHPAITIGSPAPATDRRSFANQLKAGQRLTVDRAGSAPELTSIDSKGVAGWREGRLQYMNEPLEVVVADLARYSARQILVEDPEVAALHVTGVVFEQNVDAWLSSLEATLPVRVTKRSDGSVSLERRRSTDDHLD